MLARGISPQTAAERLAAEFRVSGEKAALAVEIAIRERDLVKHITPQDICLYIGIPFCVTRCLYCSFVTAESGTSARLIAPFLSALRKEIRGVGELLKHRNLNVAALYIGGGTPTVLSEKDLTTLIKQCKITFGLENLSEFTVEAGRPDTIDGGKLDALKDGGVTRISVNPQSMNDATLRAVGRRHTAQDVRDAVALARQKGFDNINMDIIAGLPYETELDFLRTLQEVETLSPESVTVHTLSVKRGSRLREVLGEFALTDGGGVRAMTEAASAFLPKRGKKPYYLYRQKNTLGNLENVGYAKAGRESLYNVLMMEELSTVISLGGGGVTKVIHAETGKIRRAFNVKEPKAYIERLDEMLERKRLIFQYL
jgi:oxygen-independent coproporphyrinogen-3 oxidase